MQQALIITFVGSDRPGIIQEVANTVEQHGGSWAGSRMSHLAGQFAGVALIHCPAEQTDALTNALNGLSERGIILHVKHDDEPAPAATQTGGEPARLRLSFIGHDRPGLVRQVTAAISLRHINVERLNTDVSSAPMTGDQLFTLDAELTVPPDADLDELRDTIDAIGQQLDLDVTLQTPGEPG